MDCPQPSRWNKTTRGEFEGSVSRDSQEGKRFLASLRAAYSGPIGIHMGNHDERPKAYFERFCPALDMFADAFRLDFLPDFEWFGITLLPGRGCAEHDRPDT